MRRLRAQVAERGSLRKSHVRAEERPDRRRIYAQMPVRALPVALVLASALADRRGAHALAFYFLLAAVPAAAGATLAFFGSLLDLAPTDEGETRARIVALLSALALGLIVVAASSRSPALLIGDVPALGRSAVSACLCVYAFQVLVLLAPLVPATRAAVADARTRA